MSAWWTTDDLWASIIGRDLRDVANVRSVENIERLLYVIAARSGGLGGMWH